jgi:RNA polymerase sigma-70 factor, ECF subfamily
MDLREQGEAAFTELVHRYRRQLHVHCYRMLGSFDEAEDVVQDVLLRAWRGRAGFEGRSSPRVWLYRIATNACLDRLRHQARQPRTVEMAVDRLEVGDVAWLQPYPDALLDEDPAEASVHRETIELVFVAALQLLPPRQRAVLILSDVLGWTTAQTASLVEATTAAVNSALQRARATLRDNLPQRSQWSRPTDLEAADVALLQRYVEAHERGDTDTVLTLLHDDLHVWMPPDPRVWRSRAAYADFAFAPEPPGRWRLRIVAANRQPAAAFYLQRPGESGYRATALQVLRMEAGLIVEIAAFRRAHFITACGLPLTTH